MADWRWSCINKADYLVVSAAMTQLYLTLRFGCLLIPKTVPLVTRFVQHTPASSLFEPVFEDRRTHYPKFFILCREFCSMAAGAILIYAFTVCYGLYALKDPFLVAAAPSATQLFNAVCLIVRSRLKVTFVLAFMYNGNR